jgi:hypothetical protein
MYKTIIALAFGTLFLPIAASTSYAADVKANEPLSKPRESIEKNLQQNPGNKGLKISDERLKSKQARHGKQRAQQNAKRNTQQIVKKEKPDKQAEKARAQGKSDHAKRKEDSGSPLRRDR